MLTPDCVLRSPFIVHSHMAKWCSILPSDKKYACCFGVLEIDDMAKPSDEKKQPRQATQLDKFKAAARELETNNDPAAFDAKVRKIVKPAKPKGR